MRGTGIDTPHLQTNKMLHFLHMGKIDDNMMIDIRAQSPKAVPPRAAIIGLDFAGAYDRVDRGFLYKAMVAFGFPPATIRWVQTLYETSEARVLLNCTFGKPIVFERGIKQGCPLAMLLYIIYIEPLLLRFKKELAGVKIAGHHRYMRHALYREIYSVIAFNRRRHNLLHKLPDGESKPGLRRDRR